MQDFLSRSVQYIKNVGPKRAASFQSIGISTIGDLLFYFPSRYLDRSTILNSAKVLQYVFNGFEGEVTIIGKVVDQETIRYGSKQIFKVQMKDTAGYFECVWFHGAKYFKDKFKEGEVYAVSAKPVVSRYGNLQLAHPDFDKLADKESKDFFNTGKIIPFYRLPKELKATNIGDISLRTIIHTAVEKYADDVRETLPEKLIQNYNFPRIGSALKIIHFPESESEIKEAMERFKYEELFFIEVLVALRKRKIKTGLNGISFKVRSASIKPFLDSLPFHLTNAQLKVLSQIRSDLESSRPMNRLLQGDVGSGKTIVALIAMLIAADNGFQSALMAPTEILADQHYRNISRYLQGTDINCSLLIGGQKKSDRNKILTGIKSGNSKIIIGTHALIEDAVAFDKLGLVIIDEQHRFGVAQRQKLILKNMSPHVLVMTATPIPRTLTMTLYGDMDVSVIDEMPADRIPIKTVLRGESKLPDVYKFIINKIKEGNQAFIVYPLVEESAKLELKAAQTYYHELKSTYLSDCRVGLLHGRMNWKEKDEIMLSFARKEFDVLISTTVIEVGIDIPDANIIVINDTFRFGLSQLHQLRGRVGRSGKQAYCILIAGDEFAVRSTKLNFDFEYLSRQQIEKHKTIIRMNAMLKYSSGFDLSEIDLKLRGPGDIFGIQQSGFPELKFADIINDGELLIKAKSDAFSIIDNDPNFEVDDNKIILSNLRKHFLESINYSKIL
ncbi:MAG: ATP-dependent DNA helicase RecG [bacterium]